MKPSLKARGTLKDVAQFLGVSHTTVSNAYSRPDQLSAELREKILAAARSLNYPGPNPAARMLRTGIASTIAVMYADPLNHAFQDPTASAFMSGVAEACAQRSLALLLLRGGAASLRTVQNAAIDGLIIYSMSKDGGTIQAIADRGLPIVVVDQPLLPKVPFVGVDDRAAARACARHIAELGHRRIGIVTFPLDSGGNCGLIDRKRLKEGCFEVPRRRIEGYLEVLDRRGRGVSVKVWECLRADTESGRAAAAGLFKDEPRPTAILATSDRLAIGVMEAAREYRLRIPEDVAVVGFDDIPEAQWLTPQLTTVFQPMAEKGRRAVGALLNETGPLRCKLPTRLMIRESTTLAAGGERAKG